MKSYIPPHALAFYTAAPDPATPRNFRNEMNQTLRGFQDTAGGYFALDQQFQPLRTGLQLDLARQSALGFDQGGQHHPGTLELGRYGTEFQRAGDVSDVQKYGPAVTAAALNANPYLASGLNNLSGRMQDSPILSALNLQAQQQLAQGGQLSNEDIRAATQSALQDSANMGNAHGNQALAAGILSRDALSRQRAAAAQQFAGNVQGMNQQQNDFVGRGTQISGSALPDLFSALIGRSSGAGGSGGGAYPQPIGSGSTLFDPTNAYAGDIYSSNQNAQYANNVNQANAQNANTATWTTLVGALLSDKRLKTDLKKTGEKTIDGIPIVEGRYKHDKNKRRYRMVLADDVEKVRPDAVLTDPISGLRAVNYGAIAAPFQEIFKLRKAA